MQKQIICLFLNQEIQTKRPNFNTQETTTILKKNNLYDNKGNVLEYSLGSEGIPITVIWGYHQNYPIAEIKGVKYADLMQILGESSNSLSYLNLELLPNLI
jgi:hypothetical protein